MNNNKISCQFPSKVAFMECLDQLNGILEQPYKALAGSL